MYTPYLRVRSRAFTRGLSLTLMLVLGLAALLVARLLATPTTAPVPAIKLDFDKLPLSFVPDVGQAVPTVHFQVHDSGSTIFFTPGAAVLALPERGASARSVVRLRFEGANPAPAMIGIDRLPGTANYFVGNDPAKWRTNLPTYAGLVYQQLYPGVDLRYDGTSGQLKGTYTVAPGADPSCIRWRYAGAADVRLEAATGDLLIAVSRTAAGGYNLIEHAPAAWQDIDGERVSVDARYALADDGSVGLALGSYDPTWPLTIDPTLIYGTYLGGSGFEEVEGIALDSDGNIYVAGTTSSTDLPTEDPVQPSSSGEEDVFVAKINAAGDTLVYSTYIGGDEDDDASGVAVDGNGNAYVTGDTDSTDFPTRNPLQPRGGLDDAFVVKLNADGNALVYSTYLGGSHIDEAEGIAVDGSGNAYVTGATFSSTWLTDNPMRAYSGMGDAFVVKLNASGSALAYGTYLGGSGSDFGSDIAVDNNGYAYVSGEAYSTDFPTENPLQADYGGFGDVFVAKLNADGNALVYSTYLGGSYKDYSYGIAIDSGGNAYVTGSTESTDFPTTTGALDTTCGTDGNCDNDTGFYTHGDAFVAKLNDSGNALLYGTYLGGSNVDKGYAIAVDNTGDAYVAGDTYSDDFSTLGSLQGYGGDADAFVVKLDNDGSVLIYSTYLGGSTSDYGTGIATDNAGNVFVVGITFSEDFPVEDPLQNTHGGGYTDAFVARISDAPLPTPTPGPNLRGSHKTASRYVVASGETLTYTIELRNSGTVTATASVTDPVPAEMNYVTGSATGGGVYDPGTRTLTWSNVTVGPGEDQPLSFVVTATTVTTPTLVTNTATIAADGDSFERHAYVVLVSPGINLRGSHKTASQYVLASGETLTYTITLRNWGTVTATASVTDPVPAEMDYVTGSATGGGVYDPGTRTLTWSGVTAGPAEDQKLSFVVTATTGTVPTVVKNTATIAADGDSFERHIWVLLRPAPTPGPNLRGSHKTASQHVVAPGGTLTYTIRLHNSGTVTATAAVTDPVPAEMNYVTGSATGGGAYDPGTRTLTWSGVTAGPGEDQPLSFVVTATTGTVPTLVTNTATITADGDSFERHTWVLLRPTLPGPDHARPVVHALTIDEQDVLTSPAVTLHISATDDVSVDWMYLREWQLATRPFPHWKVAQSSGWVPYQADYPWTLGAESGVHFVGVWVADSARHVSRLNRKGLDYASLLLPGETVGKHGFVPYLVHYEAGVDVDATLTPTTGDPDLYVWYPGNFGRPNEKSTNPGTAPDSVGFETPREGTYLFLVHGYTAATYDLSITPGGGQVVSTKMAWSVVSVHVGETSQAASTKLDELVFEPVLSQSGLDPLGVAVPPSGPPFTVYLPIVGRAFSADWWPEAGH
jgi:uncharacterized repeat protein (TIGR01451 family)